MHASGACGASTLQNSINIELKLRVQVWLRLKGSLNRSPAGTAGYLTYGRTLNKRQIGVDEEKIFTDNS